VRNLPPKNSQLKCQLRFWLGAKRPENFFGSVILFISGFLKMQEKKLFFQKKEGFWILFLEDFPVGIFFPPPPPH
jgi:hypothetical protein